MSISRTMQANEGMDLNLNSDTPSTPSPSPSPSQVDNIFDPIYASFEEELKPLDVNMPSFDMNQLLQDDDQLEDFVNPATTFDPMIPVKPEILQIEDPDDNNLESWGVPDGITENGLLFHALNAGVEDDETPYFTRGRGYKDQFVGNNGELGVDVLADTSNFVVENGGGGGLYHYFPTLHHQQAIAFGEFSVGSWNHVHIHHPNIIERRHKRMIKNRESAARSRARRMAYNAQQKLEIGRLKEENEFLKKVLRTLVAIVTMNIEQDDQMNGLLRTFSGPLPPPSKL